jgi:hypothetical protein
MATENDNDQANELTEYQKAELAEREKEARLWAKVQQDEAHKAEVARTWESLGSLTGDAGRDFVRRQCGFDPGWR